MSDGERTTALTVIPNEAVQLGTLRADKGAELLAAATEIATPLGKLIESRKDPQGRPVLYSDISGKRYVRCEGWTTLAAMLGVTPHEVTVTEAPEGVFTAVVELRRLSDGSPVARASAECGAPDETDSTGKPLWASRARYARRSMALTRATAKACRLAFSWVMVLAGYEATPLEEMPAGDGALKLPGAPDKWNGNGGKPLAQVPSDILSKARDWLEKKDARKNAALIQGIDEVLEERRSAEDDGPEAGAA